MNNRQNSYYIYPKDKNGKHLGISICIILVDGEMFDGQATCSEKDQFSRKVGRELSYKRAIENYERARKRKDPVEVVKYSKWVSTSKDTKNSYECSVYKVEEYFNQNGDINNIKVYTDKQLDPTWTKDNQFLVEIQDTGNGYVVKDNEYETTFNYAEWEYIQLLNKVIQERSHEKTTFSKV